MATRGRVRSDRDHRRRHVLRSAKHLTTTLPRCAPSSLPLRCSRLSAARPRRDPADRSGDRGVDDARRGRLHAAARAGSATGLVVQGAARRRVGSSSGSTGAGTPAPQLETRESVGPGGHRIDCAGGRASSCSAPDGQLVATLSAASLWASFDPGRVAWSADGARVAVRRGRASCGWWTPRPGAVLVAGEGRRPSGRAGVRARRLGARLIARTAGVRVGSRVRARSTRARPRRVRGVVERRPARSR